MKVTKKDLSLNNGIQKEWIITNGIGGYSSSTIVGVNTRKYHGLLVAPLTPPARRMVILSKVDESVFIEDKRYDIFSNMGKGFVSSGYVYQEAFEKEYIPTFTYKVNNDITITKSICMQYGKNTVCVLYRIENSRSRSEDFHYTTS